MAIPKILYHYCSLTSLMAILETRVIRLSSVLHMNDSKELRWFLDLATEYVHKNHSAKSAERWAKVFEDWRHSFVYCFCFSRLRDSLSQWRAYADDGHGVAIGFDSTFTWSDRKPHYSLFGANDPPFQLQPVSYDVTQHKARIDGLLKKQDWWNEDRFKPGSLLFRAVTMPILQQAVISKNPAFKEEKEWRLIHSEDAEAIASSFYGPVEVCAKGKMLVPFIPYMFRLADREKPAIAELVLGPKVSFETEHTLRLWFKGRSYPMPKITRSNASYR